MVGTREGASVHVAVTIKAHDGGAQLGSAASETHLRDRAGTHDGEVRAWRVKLSSGQGGECGCSKVGDGEGENHGNGHEDRVSPKRGIPL